MVGEWIAAIVIVGIVLGSVGYLLSMIFDDDHEDYE